MLFSATVGVVTWLVLNVAAEEKTSYTLLDIIPAHSTVRLFDTLSASVASEYEGRQISFDASKALPFEERPINIRKLNEKYKDYLYQGDMLILPERLEQMVQSTLEGGGRKKRKAFLNRMYPNTIWTSGVPYSLHWSLTQRARESILRAISFWQAATCIEFRPRTNERQFVEFIGNDDGCWSTVGKDDSLGRQVISIGRGCEHFGVTSHELAHTLGVFHEQSRWDRDAIVTINPNVVSPDLLFNFAKIPPSELSIWNLPYDVGSVMHYTPTEFSRYRSVPALTTVDPNLQQTMGQMDGPSFLDVAILNLHYRCPARCGRLQPCQNGGITDSRRCGQCICPTGFGGALCQQVAPSFSQVVTVEEAVRRFDITIRQVGTPRPKQCVYHLRAPPGKRVLVNVVRVQGRCLEGCWQDSAEFKMSTDYRPTGYRLCCESAQHRRLLSRTNVVPFIVSSTTNTMTLTFEYTYVDANVRFDEGDLPQQEEEGSTTTGPPEGELLENKDTKIISQTHNEDLSTTVMAK